MKKSSSSDALTGPFLALVKSGLYGRPVPQALWNRLSSLKDDDWATLLSMARRQTLSGLLADALELLPEEIEVPTSVDYALMAETDRLEADYLKMSRAVASLTDAFIDGGLHPVYLKGLESARFYPAPSHRELGDIDLWFPPAEFKAAKALIQAKNHPLNAPGADGSFHFTYKGFDVDVHPQYFDLPKMRKGLPEIPSPEAELLMLNVHILKHACSAGVGLRQLCDIALAYSKLPYDTARYEQACRNAGVFRWTRLLSSFLNQFLEADAPLFGQPSLNPSPLEKIIRRGGNFGHFDPSRRRALSRKPIIRKADTFVRILRSVPFSVQYAPNAAISLLGSLIKGNLWT